jgi:hypothetical protein
MNNIRQNLFFAFVYNSVGVIAAEHALSILRSAAEPMIAAADEQLGLGDRQRVTVAQCKGVAEAASSL